MDLCPEALNDVNSQKLHIEVDKLDKLSFYNILSLMRNKLAMGIVTPPKPEKKQKPTKVTKSIE